MEENEILEENEEYEETEKGPSGLSLALNGFFHHLDRGGSLGGEVMAGVTVFLLSICLIFVNMQVIGAAQIGAFAPANMPASPENIAASMTYAQLYAGSVMVAFIGSLLIGIVARVPFVQLSVLGLSSTLVSLIGAEAGLSYANLLFVNLLAAVLYAVLTAVPGLKNWVYKAMPAHVRKALPAVAGVVLISTALQMSGFFAPAEASIGALGEQNGFVTRALADLSEAPVQKLAFLGAAVGLVVYAVLKGLKAKHPVFFALIGGTLVFALLDVVKFGTNPASTDSFINFGRVWVVAGSQASDTTPFADSYLSYFADAIGAVFANFGKVLSEGMDFSGYTGSTVALVVSGVLSYLFLGLYHTDAVLTATKDALNESANDDGKVDFESAKGTQLAFWCSAAMNIVAPFFGVGAVAVSDASVAATEDGGKSGLTSIVASIGFLISLFVMAFPFLMATAAYPVLSMNQWNYFAYGNGGFVYLMQGLSFGIADAVLAAIGVSMCRSLLTVDFGEVTEYLPALAAVGMAVITGSFVAGVAVGVLAYVLVKLLSVRKDRSEALIPALKENFVSNLLSIGAPTAVLAVLTVVLLVMM